MRIGKRFAFLFAVMLAAAVGLSGCSSKEETVTIVATNNSFDSQMFHNAVAKYVVENGFEGYAMEFSTGSSTLNWQAMINGEVDLDIESWTDNVATYEDDVANGDIIPLGIIVEDSAQGFYVPRYVIEGDSERGIEAVAPDLKTVADLVNYADVFVNPENAEQGVIYGAIPGWMIDEVMYNKYVHYGLDTANYEYFRSGSEAVLFASLNSAYNLGEPWVGYCYEPTWVTGKLDLVLLEDEPFNKDTYLAGGCEIPKQALKIVSSNQFAERAPDLVDFFSNYKTGSALVSGALAHMDETGASHDETAIWFLKENTDLLYDWLSAEQAEAVIKSLEE